VSVGSRALVSVSTAVSCWFHETLLYLARFQLLSFFSLQLISFHAIANLLQMEDVQSKLDGEAELNIADT
jgi:hypothetical protein